MGVKGVVRHAAIFLLFSLFIAPAFAAEPFTVTIDSDSTYVWAGKYIKYTATIKNNLDSDLLAEIKITNDFGKTYWVTLTDPQVFIRSGATKEVVFYVSPGEDALDGLYTFLFHVKSSTDDTITTRKNFDMYVKQKTQLNIQSFKASKELYRPGEPIEIIMIVKNVGSRESDETKAVFVIEGKTEKILTETIPPLKVDKTYIVRKEYSPDKYEAAGPYYVTGKLLSVADETLREHATEFSVEESPVIKRQEDSSSTILYSTIQIAATNEGNKAGTVEITKDLFGPRFLYEFREEPVKRSDGYVWKCTLAPGDSCLITYKINYWMYGLLAAILVAAFLLTHMKLQTPHLAKRGYKKGKEYSVHLDFKNRSRQTLQNVEVRDLVPSVLAVGTEFSVKPARIVPQKNGTLVLWHLGTMQPGEEKILSYKVKPVLTVEGSIKLPKAEITALDTKGKRYTGVSAPLRIE